MSNTQSLPAEPAFPDADVQAKLAAYEQSRSPNDLREAADAAALHDRQPAPDPALALRLARQRLAGWLAILALIHRDLDPSFDPEAVPPMSVAPPLTASGVQYPPGVRPDDVKDPEARRQYVADIERNRERIANFDRNSKLFAARDAILERAAPSILDAHQTLGLPLEQIRGTIQAAAIAEHDREALLAAIH